MTKILSGYTGSAIYACTAEKCDYKETRTAEAKKHNYELVNHVDVSCTSDGSDTWKCANCGDEQTKIAAAHGHTEGDWEAGTAATCSAAGTEIKKCTICGEQVDSRETAKLAHTEGDWEAGTAATCKAAGTEVKKCTVCGEEVDSRVTAKLPHTTVVDNAKAATCTAAGLTKGTHCGVCGEVLTKQESVPALGHTGGTATCIKKAVCTRCKKEYGSLAAHKSDKTWKTMTNATVSKAGLQTQNCTVCGAETARKEIAKLKASLTLPGKIKSFEIKKGKKVTFKVTMTSGDTLKSCKSDNPKVVQAVSSKSNGTVTLKAVKKGTTKLKFVLGKSNTTFIFNVKVVTGTVKAAKVTLPDLAKISITLQKGKTHTLKPVVVPFTSTQKPTYKTSNKKIAKVSAGGKITAVAPGTATITVKAGNAKATVAVTVAGIGNVKTSLTLKRNKTTKLRPKLYGISDKVSYASSNTAIAKVDAQGKITAGNKKGTATITVKAGKYSVKCKVKVK